MVYFGWVAFGMGGLDFWRRMLFVKAWAMLMDGVPFRGEDIKMITYR